MFFPRWGRYFDACRRTWLDKEVFYDPPEGEEGELDLVDRVPVRGSADPAEPDYEMIHIEVESGESVARLRSRIPRYFRFIRQSHKLPAVSLGLYLRTGLRGRGYDQFEEKRSGGNQDRFVWPYIGLPKLDGRRYIQKRSVVAAAFSVFMNVPVELRARHLAEVLRKIAKSQEAEHRKLKLAEMAQTYLRLNADETEKFQELIRTPTFREARGMAVTFYEQGFEKGIEQGRRLERETALRTTRIDTILLLIEEKFGAGIDVSERLKSLSLDQLGALLRDLAGSEKSLAELGLVSPGGKPRRAGRDGTAHS